MLLEHKAHLGLLEHDPISSILSHFPLDIRRSIVRSVAETLLAPSPSPGVVSGGLATSAHGSHLDRTFGGPWRCLGKHTTSN
ncbi:hypothetical protein M427DRAFT_59109, partial [Gonapodya prolifera JEL478]